MDIDENKEALKIVVLMSIALALLGVLYVLLGRK